MALEDGIDFHLKMENDWSDSAENVSDGVPNGAGFVADDPVGIYSGLFDGNNDRTVWTNEAIMNPGLNDFTYGVVAKFSKNNAFQFFMDKGFSFPSKRVVFGKSDTNQLIIRIGSTIFFSGLPTTDTSNFHLFLYSVDRDSGNSFMQLDNTFQTFNPTVESGTDLTTSANMVIGSRDDGASGYLGARVSQLTKWNRFLSQAEGLEYYNNGSFRDLFGDGSSGRRRKITQMRRLRK